MCLAGLHLSRLFLRRVVASIAQAQQTRGAMGEPAGKRSAPRDNCDVRSLVLERLGLFGKSMIAGDNDNFLETFLYAFFAERSFKCEVSAVFSIAQNDASVRNLEGHCESVFRMADADHQDIFV